MTTEENEIYSEAVDALAKDTVKKIDRTVALNAPARFNVEHAILEAFGKLLKLTSQSMFPKTETADNKTDAHK